LANESVIFAPESTPRARKTSTLSGNADVLARKPACNNVAWDAGEFADVSKDGDSGPSSSEHCSAIRVDFAEGNCFESGTL
jgi:hypothetical protein